jgi:LysR family transcriptional regulator, transcriptional activator of the cysJI operon
MNLEARLRAFAALARERSFSRAAQVLYVSQPAVSKHVALLEAELGAQLVIRDRRGLRLTAKGEVVADYVLRAEALLANARRALRAGADAQSGTLALAASGIPGTYVLPEVLMRFRERHPGVEIEFALETSASALELVRAHRAELAVVGALEVPQELEAEPLIEDDIVLIGPPSLAARHVTPKELEELTWFSRDEGSATRAALELARWEVGVRQVDELDLPSWEAVKLAVARGGGIAAISRLALGVEVDSGAVAILDVPRWNVSRTIAVVRARKVPLTPPAERFVSLLRKRYRAHTGSVRDSLFEQMTEHARDVLVFAQDEAQALKHNYIGTEHILLGLLREENGVAARVLQSLDVMLDEVRGRVARMFGQGDDVTTGEIPFTSRTKRVLDLALDEALALGSDSVDTEHILLGLACEDEGVAVAILLDLDADAETIRSATFRVLGRPDERRGG